METNRQSRLCGMLGFAMRAGKVIIGTELVLGAMKRQGKDKVKVALVASDASEGTKKKVRTKGEFYGIETKVIDIDSAELGRLLGKTFGPATVGIVDDGFAKEISKAAVIAHSHGGEYERKEASHVGEVGDSNDV
ncbi:MAG: ribosomal L7Ae/L30e/S12e/Gadd45 family protein [Clostridia bacterium]|nr:ribosomal L7Ae/L30e/S12e/Gadd45 family protein [Clostridia bacterium]